MLQGYDSVRIAWGGSDEPVNGWDEVVTRTKSGRIRSILNPYNERFQVTRDYYPESGRTETAVQASLPKVLHGRNAGITLQPSEAVEALEKLDSKIHQYFPHAPEAPDMAIRRIDATADRALSCEGQVKAVIRYLMKVQRRNLQSGDYPIVGRSGTSVSWPRGRGGVTWKAYGKQREAMYQKEPENVVKECEGLLRVEAQANGQRALKSLGLCSEAMTIGELLQLGEAPGRIIGGLGDLVDQAIRGTGGAMTWWDAFLKMKHSSVNGKVLRTDRVCALMMYARVARAVGWENIGISREKVWQAKKEFTIRGVDPLAIDFSDRDFEKDIDYVPEDDRQILLPYGGE